MNKEELWSKGYTYGGGFYIHLHQKHIGAMMTHKPSPMDSLVRTFVNQKNNAKAAIKNEYKELFIETVDEKSKEAITALFEDNDNIDKMDKVLYQYFKEGLDSQTVQNIISAQKDINWGDSSNFKKILQQNSKKWEGFDSLLEGLAKGVELLNQTDGPSIAAVLRNAQKKGTLGGVGRELERELQKKEAKINNTTIQGKNLQKAVDNLKLLASRLATGDTSGQLKENRKKDSPLTIEFLKSSIDRNFFSTILGESSAMNFEKAATTVAGITIEDALNSISSTGKDTTKSFITSIKGSYAGNVTQGDKKQGKADIKFKNVKLTLEDFFPSPYSGQITLSIGLSNKAYKTLTLGKDGTITNNSLVTGGSIKITDVFNMLTNHARIKYLGYNVLAWTSDSAPSALKDNAPDLKPALTALQDALFIRSIIHIFSARGKQDFANFMYINGQLVSIWDIINRVSKQKDGIATTSTMKNSGQGVIYSIPGRYSWWKSLNENNNSLYNNFTRTETLNNAINEARIEGHINPFAFK